LIITVTVVALLSFYLGFYFLLFLATVITIPAIIKKAIPNIIYGNKNRNHDNFDHPKLHNTLRTNAHSRINSIFNT